MNRNKTFQSADDAKIFEFFQDFECHKILSITRTKDPFCCAWGKNPKKDFGSFENLRVFAHSARMDLPVLLVCTVHGNFRVLPPPEMVLDSGEVRWKQKG